MTQSHPFCGLIQMGWEAVREVEAAIEKEPGMAGNAPGPPARDRPQEDPHAWWPC
jgi:hypothetical protein